METVVEEILFTYIGRKHYVERVGGLGMSDALELPNNLVFHH